MYKILNKLNIRNYITKQYHCLGSISEGRLMCPNCNLEVPVEIKIEDNPQPPVSNKIERDNEYPDIYPDMRGHVDRY